MVQIFFFFLPIFASCSSGKLLMLVLDSKLNQFGWVFFWLQLVRLSSNLLHSAIGFTIFYKPSNLKLNWVHAFLQDILKVDISVYNQFNFFLLFCNLQIVFFCFTLLLQNSIILICRGILSLASFYTLILQLESYFSPPLKKLLSELMIIIGPPSYETCELHLDWNIELPQVNFNAVTSFS